MDRARDAYQAAFLLASKFVNGPGNPGESSLLEMAPGRRSAPLSSLRSVDHPRLSWRHAWLDENAKVQSSGPRESRGSSRFPEGDRFAISSDILT